MLGINIPYLFTVLNQKPFCFYRKFNIFNPTAENLSYKWVSIQTTSKSAFSFNCLNPSGVIQRGSSTEAIFTFCPQSFGIFEAFYHFDVPKYDLTTNFLLYGIARKPKVYFDKPHINLKPCVLGIEVVDEIFLKNDDNVPCKFKILKESLASSTKDHNLVLDSLHGELLPHSSKPIK